MSETPGADALVSFREYRYRVGHIIHDLGGYKGLADSLGPLGDSIENMLASLAPEPAGLIVERLARALDRLPEDFDWDGPELAAAIAYEYTNE